jgi:regulator of cell morphogenesis and NO signaling
MTSQEVDVNTISENTTLGALVTARPALARELERHGLDYCCGGGQTLEAACAVAGLDLVSVAAELAAVGDDEETAPWAAMDLVDLVHHIESTHHRYLHDELPRLSALLDKVAGVHGERHPELRAVVDAFAELRSDLEPHLLREERVLFPAIRALATATTPVAFSFGTIDRPISVMLAEHDRAGELLARLRALTDGYRAPGDACASYDTCYAGLAELEADTHLHVHKENNVLFPMVLRREELLADVDRSGRAGA